jgi:hypothetical protein
VRNIRFENEQITYITRVAAVRLTGRISGGCIDRRVAALPSVENSGVEDTLDVDIFSPPRQDWLDKRMIIAAEMNPQLRR